MLSTPKIVVFNNMKIQHKTSAQENLFAVLGLKNEMKKAKSNCINFNDIRIKIFMESWMEIPISEKRDFGIFSTLSLACKRFKRFEAILGPREALKLFLRRWRRLQCRRCEVAVLPVQVVFVALYKQARVVLLTFGAESRTKKL